MPETGVNTITVPGAVDGWQKLADKFGRKKIKRRPGACRPNRTRRLPRHRMGGDVLERRNRLSARRRCRRKIVFASGSRSQSRRHFHQFRSGRVAATDCGTGRDAFYKGEISKKILETISSVTGA